MLGGEFNGAGLRTMPKDGLGVARQHLPAVFHQSRRIVSPGGGWIPANFPEPFQTVVTFNFHRFHQAVAVAWRDGSDAEHELEKCAYAMFVTA